MADVVYYENPFNLREPTATHKVDGCPTVAEWLASSGYDIKLRQQPIVLVLNAEELLEQDFDRRLSEKDLLVLTAIPEAQVIPVIVEFISTYWAYIAVAVVLIGAALVLPGMLEPTLQEGIEQDSPNHSLANRGNRARMGNPKPVLYGKARIYPDLSSQAFSEFDTQGNQIVSMLYELTQGSVAIESGSMRFEDTLLSSFSDAEYEVIEPGDTSSLFPKEVNVSSEVSNIEVEGTTIGPFAANPTATTISRIGIDLIAPGGIFYQSSSGKQQRWTVVLKFEARLINNAGSPLGSWTELGRPVLTGFDRKAIRQSFSYVVASGRYEVRLSRVDAPSSSTKVVDDISWAQLKGYYDDNLPTTTTTRVAVRIRASDQLGNRALTKFNLVATRKLPIWNGTSWSALTATTNPAWAFADACRSTYGGRRPDAYIDLAGLLTLSSAFTTAGYECNGIIDTKMSLWDALVRICQTCHCMPIDRGGIYAMVQDKAVTTPVQMFNMRNIVRGSFSIDHAGVLEETADHVIIKYYDEDQDYRLVSIPCILPSGTDDRPREVTLWGVTARDQAYEMGMRLSAANRYRRQIVSFETGLEGRIPSYMDPVIVSHRLLGLEGSAQVSGDVLTYNGTNTITVTESLTGLFTTPYVWLHDLEGEPKGPYACTVTADKTIRIDEAFDDDGLVFSSSYAKPRFAIGETSAFHAKVKVTKVTPTDQHRVRIEGFIDAPEVYTITDGETPPTPTALRDLQALAPTVTKLKAAADGTTVEPDVLLTWEGKNADQYEVQYSTDNSTWYSMGYVREPRFNDTPNPGAGNTRYYRVAGISVFRGAWATLTINISDLLEAHVPSVPNTLTVNVAEGAAEIRVRVPNETTTGAPSEIKIYRATYPSTTFASASLLETVPATYDQENDRYVGFLVDASVSENQRYYYFALPTNPNGDAADHYPTGSNPGVSAIIVPTPPVAPTSYFEDFSHGSLVRFDADWNIFQGTGERQVLEGTTPIGKWYLRLGNNSLPDEVDAYLKLAKAVPLKLNQLYMCRMVIARLNGASAQLICGVAGVKDDKVTLINADGTTGTPSNQFFWLKNGGVPGTTSFVEYVCYFKRTGGAVDHVSYASTPKNPAIIHADAHYAVPIFYTNYSAQAGEYAIALIELREYDQQDFASTVANVPVALTDGRVAAGLDANGDLIRAIQTSIANSSSLLRYSGGGLFTGNLAATLGATWNTNITGQPADTAINNTSARVFYHPPAVIWNSYGTTSSDYSPSSSTQSATVEVRDGTGSVVATRTVTGTVTYSSGNISVDEDTVDGIAVTRTGNNTDTVTVTLTYSGKTSTMTFTTRSTTTGGVGK